jgi:hypothetical protein
METTTTIPDPLSAVRNLTLAGIERPLAELGVERAQLSSLRRSVVARERARHRTEQHGRPRAKPPAEAKATPA